MLPLTASPSDSGTTYLRAFISPLGKDQSYEDTYPDSKENLITFYATQFYE
jgi:hypothetical protein